ncbi:MAG: DUF559 domain-containing protein [Patescibacteria group bacterium]|mgnify:CR=1 FL=1
MRIYNKNVFKDRRRELRRNQTKTEKLLWQQLRNNKVGTKFWRQYSVGPYILDFYSPKLKLAIELDGEYHSTPDQMIYDKERESYLLGLGIRTLHFRNGEVILKIGNVIKSIEELCFHPRLV